MLNDFLSMLIPYVIGFGCGIWGTMVTMEIGIFSQGDNDADERGTKSSIQGENEGGERGEGENTAEWRDGYERGFRAGYDQATDDRISAKRPGNGRA